jgi:hypothetical protein
MMADQTQAPGKPQEVDRDSDMIPSPSPAVVTLAEAAGLDLDPARAQALLGTKAANLARLLRAGFPVPAGVVVTPAATADWDQACTQLRTAWTSVSTSCPKRSSASSPRSPHRAWPRTATGRRTPRPPPTRPARLPLQRPPMKPQR